MKKHYDYVLFDLDGTLSNSAKGIYNALDYMLDQYGIIENDMERKRSVIGPPLRVSFKRLFGFDDIQLQKAIEFYHDYYADKGWKENELYPGLEKLIISLHKKGKKIVLATSKPEEFASKILNLLGVLDYFDFISAAEVDKTENKTDIINKALKGVECDDLSKAIMVGDRYYDIDGAIDLGIDSIGVTYGYGTQYELERHKATYIANNAKDIKKFVG